MKKIMSLSNKSSGSKVNKTIWQYYLFTFFRDFAFFSAVLVPFFTQWGNISLIQVQFLQSWFMLWIFLLEVPTGVIADCLGRKYSLALGTIVWSMAALIYGSVPHFAIFLIGEFFFAMAMALISGADSALLYDSLKEAGREAESKSIFGKAHSIHLFGIFLSAPLGGIIADKWGLNYPMLFSALPISLAGFIAWKMKEPVVEKNAISESTRYLDIAKKGLRFFLRHPNLRWIALDGIIVASAAYFVIWLYQPLLMSLNVSVKYYGWFHALLVAIEMLIASNFGRLENFLGSAKKYLRFSAVITGLAFILAAVFPSFISAMLLIVLAGGFGLTRIELMMADMNRVVPSAQRATVLSFVSMFRRLALVLLNPLIGYLADYSLSLALLIVGLLPFLVLFISANKQETQMI